MKLADRCRKDRRIFEDNAIFISCVEQFKSHKEMLVTKC